MSSSVTFVSAFIECVGEQRADEYANERYFTLFEPLAKANLNLVVFISPHLLENARSRWPSVKFEPIVLSELETARIVKTHETITLPPIRTRDKDTVSYLTLINSKTELVRKVINDDSRVKTKYYAWIDFGISKVLRQQDPVKTLTELNNKIETTKFNEPFLAIPGCWSFGFNYPLSRRQVVWRFCGGFFVGDEKSIVNFDDLSQRVLDENLRKTGVLTWEVNTWATMEFEHGWKPNWYSADHNETMLTLPDKL